MLPALAMAERSRSPRREKYLWVKVKGGGRPIKINFTELHDVDDLLETVKRKVEPYLSVFRIFGFFIAKGQKMMALKHFCQTFELLKSQEVKK